VTKKIIILLTTSPPHQLTNSPTHQLASSPARQLTNSPARQLASSPAHQLLALGIEVESPERGTSEDLERKARPVGERPEKNAGI